MNTTRVVTISHRKHFNRLAAIVTAAALDHGCTAESAAEIGHRSATQIIDQGYVITKQVGA